MTVMNSALPLIQKQHLSATQAHSIGNTIMLPIVADSHNRQQQRKHQKFRYTNGFIVMLPMLPITILKFTIKENIDNEQHIYIYTSKKIKKLSATAHRQHQIRLMKTAYME